MSELNPKGTPVRIGGEEHGLLFTLNAVDDIQDKMGMPIDDAIDCLSDYRKAWKACKTILCSLLNDETERRKHYRQEYGAKSYTEEEVGWMVTEGDKYEILAAILKAYGAAVPEDEDPNPEGARQPGKN